MPDPATATDAHWADYVFNRRANRACGASGGTTSPSGTWFIAERDTLKDEFIRTYLYRGHANSHGVNGQDRGRNSMSDLPATAWRMDRPQPDRRVPLRGPKLPGFAGDTIASALWASGVDASWAQLQVSPAARRLLAWPTTMSTAWSKTARRTNIRADVHAASGSAGLSAVNTVGGLRAATGDCSSSGSPVLAGRLLLQGVSHAAKAVSVLRAADPAMAGLGAGSTRSCRAGVHRRIYSFCDVLVVGARPGRPGGRIAAAEQRRARDRRRRQSPRPAAASATSAAADARGAGTRAELLSGCRR